MVTRLLIFLVLLVATAQGQGLTVTRKVLRPDLGTVSNNTGQVLWAPLTDGVAIDRSGQGKNGTVNGGATVSGRTARFAAGSMNIHFGDIGVGPGKTNIPVTVTISGRVTARPDALAAWWTFNSAAMNDSQGGLYTTNASANITGYVFYQGTTRWLTKQHETGWHTITVTHSRPLSRREMWIDGVLVGTDVYATDGLYPFTYFRIGNSYANQNDFVGELGAVEVLHFVEPKQAIASKFFARRPTQ